MRDAKLAQVNFRAGSRRCRQECLRHVGEVLWNAAHCNGLVLMPAQIPARRVSHLWEQGVHTRARFGVAQFVIDAIVLLLHGPHDLHVDAPERLPANTQQDVVGGIDKDQSQYCEERYTLELSHMAILVRGRLTTIRRAGFWRRCRKPTDRPVCANAVPWAAA